MLYYIITIAGAIQLTGLVFAMIDRIERRPNR